MLQIRNVSHSSLSSTTTTAPKKSQEKFRTVQIQFFSTSNFDFPTLAEVEFPRIDILNIANDKALTEENKAPSATSRRQFLIESLSKEVERNVAVIVQRIDSLKSKIQQPDDGGSHGLKSPRKAFETSLAKRWKAAYQREKERHYGIYAEGNNPKKSLNKVTIDDLWEQSMQSNGIEFLLESQYKKVDSVRDMSQSTPSKSFAVVENQTTKSSPMCSPIFGLEITETGLVLEKSTTGSVSYIIDLQENSPSDTEALSSNSAAMATAVHSSSHKSKTITNGILCCLALFATARKNEWALFRSDPKNLGDMKSTHQEERANFDLGELESDFASELLQDSQIKRLLLSSDECNLLLARLLSSPSMKEENILEKGLQFFNEMQRLAATGIEDGGPDANTYRLLFSALPRRLAATGEAAQICKTMASSYVEWNPETLLEAMRVCQGYGDLDTASKLIARALTHHIESPVRVGSCTIFLEMLQAKSMMKEALSFYDEIQKVRIVGT